jgi:flagellar M-ring protein FliF
MSELQAINPQGVGALNPAVVNAEAAAANSRPAESAQGFGKYVEQFKKLDPQKRLALIIVLPLLLGLIMTASMWNAKPEYKTLFAGVNETDGGAIINSLKQMGVPYQYSEGGGSILVPADKVYDTRLQLASQGLPKGSVVGFELFENQKMGVTQFQEQVNFQRGLEGELIRSIQSLDAVASARVHLALPKNNVFLREQQKPTASVVVTLHRGKYLSKNQLDGIVHLVSSSVPQLGPRDVSVVDQTGELLTNHSNPNDAASLTADQMAKVQKIEETYNRRLMDLLIPIVGANNVRASVSAKVNFQEVERSAETFKPNAENGASIRSQQSTESNENAGANPRGVPGMISNAPGDAVARIGGNLGNQAGAAGSAGSTSQQSKEALTNYEVDRETVRTKSNRVDVAQINAAVLLNNKAVTNSKGETREVPFSEAEMASIKTMVSDALGIDENRGDTLSVVNQSFVATPVETPLQDQPETWVAMLKQSAIPLGLLAVALALILGVLRPMVKGRKSLDKLSDTLLLPKDPLMDSAPQAEEPMNEPIKLQRSKERPMLLVEDKDSRQINEVQRVVRENPELAANIVKGWIGD